MTNKNIEVAKAQAMGAMMFVINSGYRHCKLSVSQVDISLIVFCDSLGELEFAKSQLRPFMSDGCTMDDDVSQSGDSFWVEGGWPFPYYGAI